MKQEKIITKIKTKIILKSSFLFSDEKYLKLLFKSYMGYKLNLKYPKTFSEKLQWLKLYNRNPLYTIMVDKVKVKEYVANKIGRQYIIPTLGVWDNVYKIDFNQLPNQFVIKCNHNSGKGMFICKDKSKININKIRKELNKGLKQDYYSLFREWPYKNVPRRILAEQYLESNDNLSNENENKASLIGNLRDYKLYCFNGEPKLCQIISDRAVDEKIDFYDMNWNRIPNLVGLTANTHNSNNEIPCPKSFNDMYKNACILSQEIPFSRIDFYDINGKAYFGEITFFPASGLGSFYPQKWNDIIGEWITLPSKTIE